MKYIYKIFLFIKLFNKYISKNFWDIYLKINYIKII